MDDIIRKNPAKLKRPANKKVRLTLLNSKPNLLEINPTLLERGSNISKKLKQHHLRVKQIYFESPS